MSDEMLQKTIDLVSSLVAKNETQQIAKYELIEYTERLHKENQELKKQLDELQTLYNNMFKCHCNRVQVETLLEQQKEFIEYLESKIDTIIQQKETFAELEAGQAVSLMTLAIALEKYKEIIGGKE